MARGKLMRWLLGQENKNTISQTARQLESDADSRLEALRRLEGLRVRAEVRLGREIPRDILELPYDDNVFRGDISQR